MYPGPPGKSLGHGADGRGWRRRKRRQKKRRKATLKRYTIQLSAKSTSRVPH